MKTKWLCLLLIIMLFPGCAAAEKRVVNLVAAPDSEWAFEEGAEILEVYFPPLKGADACILRMGNQVVMVDAATAGQRERVAATMQEVGIDHIDLAFNTHPHDDHIEGFQFVPNVAPMSWMVIAFAENINNHMIKTLKAMKEQNIPVYRASDGARFRLGNAEVLVIQKTENWFSMNDRSAMLLIQLGECRLLLTADVERDAQNLLLKACPELLEADIFKYPHHGVTRAGWNFIKHIDAELAVITNEREKTASASEDAENKMLPLLYTGDGMIRLRTDGHIWVVDQWQPEALQ